MNILHIAAHLGGGVGKAHAALCAASSPDIRRHYALLEAPRDRRYADQLLDLGARITEAPGVGELADLAAAADIVQIEWWNHPRLYLMLCATAFPAMRTVFWCHIAGLYPPLIPLPVLSAGNRFFFTSDCSFEAPDIAALPAGIRSRLGSVNSGFGFDGVDSEPAVRRRPREIVYLGTLDFVKMSPLFFDVIDAVHADDMRVSLWGTFDPNGQVAAAARAMRHPERVIFKGHASDPKAVLAQSGIFLYLLQPQHYGTAENALVEAMSIGCVPLAFSNPAESRIIATGATGFLEPDAGSAARRLKWMMDHPHELAAMGTRAMAATAEERTPAVSAARFEDAYSKVLAEDKRTIDFGGLLGKTGARWFLSTQTRETVADGDVSALVSGFSAAGTEAKGSLAHFRGSLPDDISLRVADA